MEQGIGRTILASVLAYAIMLCLIRLLGKRTIAKMNPGDFVVVVAVGSVAANFITTADVTFRVGVSAVTTLLLLQFGTERVTSRVEWLRRLMDGSPVLLVHKGAMLEKAMRHQNIDREDILMTLREHGVGRIEDAQAVVLEIDGTLSVIASPLDGALDDVRRTD